MRWNKHYQKNEDERVVSQFAISPIEINAEVRWLERVRIKQVFRRRPYARSASWENVCFID